MKPLPFAFPFAEDAEAAEAREDERAACSERMLLSEIRRWRARSLARKAALSSSWSPSSSAEGLPFEVVFDGSALGSRGGREDLTGWSQLGYFPMIP